MTGLLLVVCSMTQVCMITKVGLQTWNLEIAMCCRAEWRTIIFAIILPTIITARKMSIMAEGYYISVNREATE